MGRIVFIAISLFIASNSYSRECQYQSLSNRNIRFIGYTLVELLDGNAEQFPVVHTHEYVKGVNGRYYYKDFVYLILTPDQVKILKSERINPAISLQLENCVAKVPGIFKFDLVTAEIVFYSPQERTVLLSNIPLRS